MKKTKIIYWKKLLLKFKKSVMYFIVAGFVTLIIMSANIIQSIDTLTTTLKDLTEKKTDEQILNELRATADIHYFEERLGTPIFTHIGEEYTQSYFKSKKFWVSTIHNKSNVVVLFTVTTCDEQFKPTIKYPFFGIDFRPGVSTLKDISSQINSNFSIDKNAPDKVTEINYNFSRATGDSYMLELIYMANPGFYQTFISGVSDICSPNPILPNFDYERSDFWEFSELVNNSDYVDITNSLVDSYRKETPINTWGMSAPLFSFKESAIPLEDLPYPSINEQPKDIFIFPKRAIIRTLL